jgi:hypothetical protein
VKKGKSNKERRKSAKRHINHAQKPLLFFIQDMESKKKKEFCPLGEGGNKASGMQVYIVCWPSNGIRATDMDMGASGNGEKKKEKAGEEM